MYCNQVFVADNIKEVIPEFLLLLKGVIDCPELPLNVSRSFLQSDGYVNKISTHIIKKVADKLNGLFKKDRDAYCKYWDDINPFVKYGCLKEEKFYKKVAKSIVYKTIGGGYITIEEYKLVNKDHNPDTVYYASDVVLQGQYIKNFKTSGIEAIILDGQIDNHFISFLEYNDKETKFARIDSHISESMKDDQNHMTKFSEDDSIAIKEIFTKVADSEMLKIEIQGLKNTETPAIILLSEESRRMQEMSKMYGGMFGEGAMPTDETLIVNSSSDLIKTLLVLNSEDGRGDDVEMIARHIYDLAIMSHKPMNPDLMSAFIERSNKILAIVAKKKI